MAVRFAIVMLLAACGHGDDGASSPLCANLGTPDLAITGRESTGMFTFTAPCRDDILFIDVNTYDGGGDCVDVLPSAGFSFIWPTAISDGTFRCGTDVDCGNYTGTITIDFHTAGYCTAGSIDLDSHRVMGTFAAAPCGPWSCE